MGAVATLDSPPPSRTRGINRSLRSQNPAVKPEPPVYHDIEDDEDDGESSDGLEDDDMRSGHEKGSQKAGGVDSVVGGGRRLDAASGPVRPSKSRVKGESSQKRKEQNRIAQRAFRKRQKAYFIDLEKEVIEKSSKIQAITKSNQSFMEMMERLQRENIALKAAKAPNLSGVSPLEPFDNLALLQSPDGLDLSGMEHHEARRPGESCTPQPPVEPGRINNDEDALVSVNEVGPINNKKKRKQSASSSRRTSTISPAQSSSRSSPGHSRSPKSATPLEGQQSQMGFTAGPSSYSRRQSSHTSQASVSQTSVLAAHASPMHMSFSGALPQTGPTPNAEHVTEIINNPTWGTTDTHRSQGHNVDQATTTEAVHFAGFPTQHATDRIYNHLRPQPQPQQQQQQQQQDSIPPFSARRYSEALRKYHAETPISPTAQATRPLTADSIGSMAFGAPDRSQSLSSDHTALGFPGGNTMPFANNSGWMDLWQWNGSGFMGAPRIPLDYDQIASQPQAAFTPPSQHVLPPPTMAQNADRQSPQAQRIEVAEHSQHLPSQAACQAKMFAGVAPGLKSDAQGGIMPFAGVITPIDGLGPLDNPFRPNYDLGPDGPKPGHVWRDLGDLPMPDPQAFGIDMSNNGMLFDTSSAIPYVGQ